MIRLTNHAQNFACTMCGKCCMNSWKISLDCEKVEEYKNIILDKFNDKNIEFINTICNATKLIQKHSIEVAKEVDLMFIVGGKNSSNTNELYKKCEPYTDCIKISTQDELKEYLNDSKINKDTKIGLTGGASTPQYEINEFKDLIEEFQQNK